MKVDWLVIGAGFTGAVLAERLASQLDQKVLIVDRRNHIGGNAYDFHNENGIFVHKYGPHIFHTNSDKIWNYLSNFTAWRTYYHHVRAAVEGKLVPVPFNLNSLSSLFPRKMAARLESRLVEKYGFGIKIPILKMLDETDTELKTLAKYVYRYVFEGYTQKQWGLGPAQLDPSVTGRIPIYVSRDDRYFQDSLQGIPSLGYTKLFERMVSHPNISVLLQADYTTIQSDIRYKKLIFTGPIDEFFNGANGALPYRSLRFELSYHAESEIQGIAQINFPNEHLFTRTTEFKHITGQRAPGTVIAQEFAEPYIPGRNDPYYPIPQEENSFKYKQYLALASELKGKVYFAGRLADYKYYNMDQAVGRALRLFEEIANNGGAESALNHQNHALSQQSRGESQSE